MGPVARGSVAKRRCGYRRPMFGRWKKSSYRTAKPTDVVEAEGVAMSGPGGAPQEAASAEERRDANR